MSLRVLVGWPLLLAASIACGNPLPNTQERQPETAWANAEGKLPPLLVLVSFSMPKDSIRALAEQAARIGAPLVLRGLADDTMQATTAKVAELRRIPGLSLAIDPTVFRRFSVEAVPSVILPLEPLQGCSQSECPVPRHLKVSGEAGLDAVLGLMARTAHDAAARDAANKLLRQLEARP